MTLMVFLVVSTPSSEPRYSPARAAAAPATVSPSAASSVVVVEARILDLRGVGCLRGRGPRGGLTGVGIRRSSRSLAVDGDRESGRRLRPGLGGEPEAAPEPPPREQVAQP